MARTTITLLAGLLAATSALAAPKEPPTVAQWLAMAPQERMALREETRSWSTDDRRQFWARFDAEMKAMTPAERQALAAQAAAQLKAATPVPVPTPAPDTPLPKAVALPPPGDLTGQPD